MKEAKEKVLLTAGEISEAVKKIAESIRRDCPETKPLALIGVASGGVPLAERLKELIEAKRKSEIQFGILDITFYRDDIAMREGHPVVKGTEILFSLDGAYVVLIDDVLFSGRTTRAALDALVDFGRPDAIRLAVLVDRGHRELPIQADFVGRVVETEKTDSIEVSWSSGAGDGGTDEVKLIRGKKLESKVA